MGGVTGFDGKDFEGKKRVAAGCHKTENKINADNRNLAVAAQLAQLSLAKIPAFLPKGIKLSQGTSKASP